MINFNLFRALEEYNPSRDEINAKDSILKFLELTDNAFDRSNKVGHVTGSAWVLDPEKNKVLLTHHRKLNKWLQFGGHSDGNPNTLEVAIRELEEESGLKNVSPVNNNIFDISIHNIPAYGDEPRHKHYDARFLFIIDSKLELNRQVAESKELKWIPFSQIKLYSTGKDILRMVEKSKSLP